MADALWASVKTALAMHGANGSTSFLDSSPAAKTFTPGGNAQISTTVSEYGGGMGLFDGGLGPVFSPDTLTTTDSLTDFAFAGDFCIDFWAHRSANGSAGFDIVCSTYTASNAVDGWWVELSSSRGFYMGGRNSAGSGSATYISYNVGSFNDSTLHHWAINRSGTSLKMFKDGVNVASATLSLALHAAQFVVGNDFFNECYNGRLEALRITAASRYTANFTPPATLFDGGGATNLTETVTGIAPTTAFGTPIAAFVQTGQATGFTSTSFGTPREFVDLLTAVATGAAPATAFGTPFAIFDQIGQASGVTNTAFGAPQTLATVAVQASGFQPGAFGIASIPLVASSIAPATAFGIAANVPNAVGFSTTRFGIPATGLVATGFSATAFGSPTYFERWRASALPPTAQFGTPSTPTDRIQLASGFLRTRLGAPVALKFSRAFTARTVLASGARTTAFGHPAAAAPVTAVATGESSTSFGAPASSISDRVSASSLAPQTALGTPTVRISGHASGARATGFGTPSVNLRQPATSTFRATRFGAATCVRSNTYLARPLGPTSRVGHPRGFSRFNHPASGFAAGVAFGTPNALEGHRVTAIAPSSRLGTPLLKRNPQC